jgi:hypothetical protein
MGNNLSIPLLESAASTGAGSLRPSAGRGIELLSLIVNGIASCGKRHFEENLSIKTKKFAIFVFRSSLSEVSVSISPIYSCMLSCNRRERDGEMSESVVEGKEKEKEDLPSKEESVFDFSAIEAALVEATSEGESTNFFCFDDTSPFALGGKQAAALPYKRSARKLGGASARALPASNSRKRVGHKALEYEPHVTDPLPRAAQQQKQQEEEDAPEYTGESLLDKLPRDVVHKILFLLENNDGLCVDSDYLDDRVSLPQEGRKISRAMLSFMLSCKTIWAHCYKRGGLPSSRPLFCIMTFAARGDHQRLQEMVSLLFLSC